MAIHEQDYPVHTYESDPQGFATLPTLCNFLLDAASSHATPLGFGFDDMREREYAWVLSRLLVRVCRYPRWRESVTVRTWPSGTERIFALRDFIVRDASGAEVARATTSWLVINAVTRAPERIERVGLPPDVMHDERVFDRSAPRLSGGGDDAPSGAGDDVPSGAGGGTGDDLEGTEVPVRASLRERVRYEDIDLNGHVTSARYLSWALESLPDSLRNAWEVNELAVNFLAECRYGEEVDIKSYAEPRTPETPPGSLAYAHAITRPNDTAVLSRLRTVWARRTLS